MFRELHSLYIYFQILCLNDMKSSSLYINIYFFYSCLRGDFVYTVMWYQVFLF